MDAQCDNKSRGLGKRILLLMPTIILIAVAVLAGGTDVFSRQVHLIVSKGIHDKLIEWVPYLVNFIFAIAVLNLFGLFHHRCQCWAEKLLNGFKATQPLSVLGSKLFNIVYWVIGIFIAASFFAPGFIAQLTAGLTFITAGLTVALQGLIKDFYAGVMLDGPDGIKEGEEVKLADVSIAEGKVTKVGRFKSRIKTKENGEVTVPNNKIWESSIARKKKDKLVVLTDAWGIEQPKDEDSK
jgi:small-conductance mechanosensitive channel